jgi:ubiquinone biosynthesis protein
MLSSLRNLRSLLRILTTFARHDALFIFAPLPYVRIITRPLSLFVRPRPDMRNKRDGERLAATLIALGPSFIKLGQVLSTRSDLIGDALAHDLALLQDKLPPFPTEHAIATIEKELDAPLGQLFSVFDETPVAAASMAQVHFATTTSGEEVAVKILRPDVEKRFQRDIALFQWLARLLERIAPNAERLRPRAMVEILSESVEMELDLRYEAAAAVELKANMMDEEGFYVPEIDWARTSARVLTLERINGIAGNNIEAIRAAGHDMDTILAHAANAFFVQVFRDGFFHADMHPGNIFIMADGRIAVVDFGIMGRLDYRNRLFLAEVLAGFLTEDYYRIAKVHADFGIIPPHKSVHHFAMACMAIGKPILHKNLNEISVAKLLSQLFKVSETFEMRLQPQLLLLQKTMMLAEGIGRSLNPNINMWKMSEPLIMSWYHQNLSKPATFLNKAHETLQKLEQLPDVLETFYKALQQVAKGGRD